MRQRIVPYLWFDTEAVSAAEFYTQVFRNSNIAYRSTIHNTPNGDCDIVGFNIGGFYFMAINAGPMFHINSSISFEVNCRTVREAEELWRQLSTGGHVIRELGEYPFSKRYGWIEDKYGVSWQIIQADWAVAQYIRPTLMFTGDVCGKAEEAAHFYTSIFPDSELRVWRRYEYGEEPNEEGTIKSGQLVLEGLQFNLFDSAEPYGFSFNEGISLIINCKNQREIDGFWEHLSARPEAEQSGWVRDKYGLSWQIVPENIESLISDTNVVQTILNMKKIVIADIRARITG